MPNMLVVSTSVRVLYWVHSHTTNLHVQGCCGHAETVEGCMSKAYQNSAVALEEGMDMYKTQGVLTEQSVSTNVLGMIG